MPDTANATTSNLDRLAASLELPELRVVDEPEAAPKTPDGGPYCATCRGYRWLRLDRPVGHPEFGQAVRCPNCQDAQRAIRLNRLALIAGLADEQRRKTFAELKPTRGLSDAIKAASDFAARPDGWLVIHGEPGCGKTHLSLAVANALILREQMVVWRYMPSLMYQLRQQVGAGNVDSIMPILTDTPVLILDDLGAARWTEYVTEAMELLFDDRYRRRLPTMVTMIGPKDGGDLGEAVKASLSVSIGRRMQDRDVCRIVRNGAPQWGRS